MFSISNYWLGLQKKYNKRWKENEKILNMVIISIEKAKHILEDSAKKIGK
jgi:hypothetical protein